MKLKQLVSSLSFFCVSSFKKITIFLDDVIRFYETPVCTTVPLDALKNVELPENLHVQYDYHRFHPDTDTMFGGISAYPKSHTIVTGLKYKEKYRSFKAKVSWP